MVLVRCVESVIKKRNNDFSDSNICNLPILKDNS